MSIQLPSYIDTSRPYILGVDLYHLSKIISLKDAKAAGIDFAWVKCGESEDILDPRHDEICGWCDDADIVNGSYWFTHADKPAGPQANMLVQHGRGGSANLIRAMDTETLNGQAGSVVGSHSAVFEAAIRLSTGRGAVAYSSESFMVDNLLPSLHTDVARWVARYGHVPELRYDFWQFADGENVIVEIPGLEGPTDVNIFYGTLDGLKTNFTYGGK